MKKFVCLENLFTFAVIKQCAALFSIRSLEYSDKKKPFENSSAAQRKLLGFFRLCNSFSNIITPSKICCVLKCNCVVLITCNLLQPKLYCGYLIRETDLRGHTSYCLTFGVGAVTCVFAYFLTFSFSQNCKGF